MSTQDEIDVCIQTCQPDVIMHTNSTYPCPSEDLNLNYIKYLQENFGEKASIGYSGHEYGLVTTYAAVALGASWVERHITIDRNSWGSDQSSSIEPDGLVKLVKGIRSIEKAMIYPPQKRICFEKENDLILLKPIDLIHNIDPIKNYSKKILKFIIDL